MYRFKSLLIVFGVVSTVLLAACASSGGVPESQNQGTSTTNVDNPNLTLADYLQRIPGVDVLGSGNNISIKIRGASSFMSSTQPLYVIDSVPVGTSYWEANRMINLHYVSSIKVLKGAEASIYGVRGGNGVIMIETRKGH